MDFVNYILLSRNRYILQWGRGEDLCVAYSIGHPVCLSRSLIREFSPLLVKFGKNWSLFDPVSENVSVLAYAVPCAI